LNESFHTAAGNNPLQEHHFDPRVSHIEDGSFVVDDKTRRAPRDMLLTFFELTRTILVVQRTGGWDVSFDVAKKGIQNDNDDAQIFNGQDLNQDMEHERLFKTTLSPDA
jgi:hypothetical protein